jgi:hypothetical protein
MKQNSHTKIKCIDIECAVADYFSFRVNLIVPNVSWGLWIHECDLLIVTPAGYCYEVEIKTSRSDLKADLKKQHGHNSKRIKRLYFAIPDYLSNSIDLIPARAGILLVSAFDGREHVKCIRDPQQNNEVRKLSDEERFQVGRLGTMRIWGLKDIVRRRIEEASPKETLTSRSNLTSGRLSSFLECGASYGNDSF